MVKRYEPYFTDTPAFDSEPELVETGVSATLHYDPINRPIRTDLPDGTFTKVEFTPWIQSAHDANDSVLQSAWYTARQNSTDPAQKRAAQLAAAHANTPSVAHLDTLGRVVLTITQSDATTTHTTRNTLDLEGNLLRQDVSRDASTTLTVLTQSFDILGRVCMARHPDSGAKLIWRDVASATLRSWDTPNTADERSQWFEYDALRRPIRRWVSGVEPHGDISSLVEETTYGESLTDAKARNARGQTYSHKDGAGIATDEQRDFQGKVTRSVRQLTTSTTKDVPDWSKSVAVDETFTTLTTYDALGRVTRIDTPHNASVPASQVYPIYNEANLLDRVEASLRGATTRTTFVQNIDYDAKGQRQRITYGNGATTRYQYDPNTWRLTNLLTTRNGGSDTLQNLSYTYDATGNVVQISDAAQQTVFFNNQVVEATALYEYDATYRLTKATGREHLNHGAATEPEAEGFNTPQNLPSDGQSLRNYTRQWTYDHVGNILSLIHTATGGNWTRNYTYATDSNRLATTTVGTTTQTYTHNAHGSFTSMPHLDTMGWTADERLHHVKRGTSQTWYTYDSTGQRVRKVTEKGGLTEERLYLGGFEIYRKRQGTTVTLERETLHLMDGARRIAMVETKTIGTTTTPLPTTVTRYQLDNHLQSASLELDETASVISYEEYYPYGDTSYRSARSGVEVSEKRYRYTGKEKDEETGLYYHGARYYAAWLGRWTAADPAGMVDGACLYAYVRGNPITSIDNTGLFKVHSMISQPSKMREESIAESGSDTRSKCNFGFAFGKPTNKGWGESASEKLVGKYEDKILTKPMQVAKKAASIGLDLFLGEDVEVFGKEFLKKAKDVYVELPDANKPSVKEKVKLIDYIDAKAIKAFSGGLIAPADFNKGMSDLKQDLINDPITNDAINSLKFTARNIDPKTSVFEEEAALTQEVLEKGNAITRSKCTDKTFKERTKDKAIDEAKEYGAEKLKDAAKTVLKWIFIPSSN